MRWHDLGESDPRLADLARERLVDPGVLLVVTIRRDGSPRLSPVEPLVLDGDLWLSMMCSHARRPTSCGPNRVRPARDVSDERRTPRARR